MHAEMLFGLDPAGAEVLGLCVLLALALGALIAGGFVLLRQAERSAHQLAGPTSHVTRELGVLALWRLERALRGSLAPHQPSGITAGQSRPVGPSR